MYAGADGGVRRLVDGVASTTKASSLTPGHISDYLTTTSSSSSVTGSAGRLATPFGPTAAVTVTGAASAGSAPGHCRWAHQHHHHHQQQQQQQAYPEAGALVDADNVEDFALMASLVSATGGSSACADDLLLKGGPQ